MTVQTGNFNVQGIRAVVHVSRSGFVFRSEGKSSSQFVVDNSRAMRLVKALVRSFLLMRLVKQTPRAFAIPTLHRHEGEGGNREATVDYIKPRIDSLSMRPTSKVNHFFLLTVVGYVVADVLPSSSANVYDRVEEFLEFAQNGTRTRTSQEATSRKNGGTRSWTTRRTCGSPSQGPRRASSGPWGRRWASSRPALSGPSSRRPSSGRSRRSSRGTPKPSSAPAKAETIGAKPQPKTTVTTWTAGCGASTSPSNAGAASSGLPSSTRRRSTSGFDGALTPFCGEGWPSRPTLPMG
jgi:hypothetical protein